VLLALPEADPQQASAIQTLLNEPITAAGLRWQVRPILNPQDLTENLKLVVALPPNPALGDLVKASPGVQFLALGFPELAPASNLSRVAAASERPDQQGFIAGVIAAMITPDWRVGVISRSDTVAGKAARTGFLNGVRYFCGLCQPAYPPFYGYPLYGELPVTATAVEWQEIANYMLDHGAQTVYIVPGAGDAAMLSQLSQAGVKLIGSGEPPSGLEASWVLSLQTDPSPQILGLIPDLLAGRGGQDLQPPLEMVAINPELFSPGRQQLAQAILADLLAGFIDTGVDPLTGEATYAGP
jgi:hypothetical protein